jgi:hypothetical protein
MRKPYPIIKSAIKTAPSGGLSKLFVPVSPKDLKVGARFCDPNGSLSKLQLIAMTKSNKHSVRYETILESDVMEKEVHAYNRQWFQQAHDTPFGHGELYDFVGFDSLNEHTNSFVAHPTSPPTLATPITLQQLQLRSFFLPKHLPPIPEEPP